MTIESTAIKFADMDQRLSAAWKTIARDWAPEKPPMTLVMAEFGKVLIDAARMGDVSLLTRGLSLVETCMRDEQPVRDAVATGLLECLLSEAPAQRLDFVAVAQCLGEKSIAFCRQWDFFTGVKTPGLWG